MSWISERVEHSVIGKDIVVDGDVKSAGFVRVEGRVNGNVKCAILVTGVVGQIVGEIGGEVVTVHGHIEGNINAGSVLITESGRVEGDITSQSLAIEHGAVFAGRSQPVKVEPKVETLAVVAGE